MARKQSAVPAWATDCLPMFQGVQVPPATRAMLRGHSDNWLTIHEYIVNLEKSVVEAADPVGLRPADVLLLLQQLLLVEVSDHVRRPRWHVINRVYSRIVKWRKRTELQDLRSWLDASAKAASRNT